MQDLKLVFHFVILFNGYECFFLLCTCHMPAEPVALRRDPGNQT